MENKLLKFECGGIDAQGKFRLEYTGYGKNISPEFVIGGTLTILSWDNPVTAYFRKKVKNCATALAGHRAAILFTSSL